MQEQQKAGPLILSRRFAPLFWTQFFAAFNDNFLKQTLVFVILAQMATEGAALVTLAGGIFIVPFLLLSAIAGELADKHDKAKLAELLKRCELLVAAISVVGIAFSSIWILMLALFGFGVISSLFGPIKYGILPDHLENRDLPKANAWIEGGTFIAILGGIGGVAGPFLGALMFQIIRGYAPVYAPQTWHAVLGVMLLAIIFFAPAGLYGIATGSRRKEGGR